MDYTSLTVVLVWVVGAGAPWLTGRLVALLVEHWPTWHTLPYGVKFLSPMIFSVILAVGAGFLLKQDAIIAVIGPYWTVVAQAVIMYLSTQKAYMEMRQSGYALSAKSKPQG